MPGLKSDISKQLSGVMPQEGKHSGNLFAKGMKLALGGTAMMGAINVAKKGLKSIYDVSVGGGLNRVMQIDQAKAKLTGLGHSGKEVSSIMGSALASVKGTAFGLGDAATVAATLSASGIAMGKDLTGSLKLVADTATISGRELTDIGAIFSSVAARGKLQGDDMLQLLSSGIPVLQFLAAQTGKTTAEVSDMVSSGEVDFKLFSAAMQKGLGGAAMSSGNTFAGAMANVKAALGRVSANALTVPMDALRKIFLALIPVIDKFGDAFKPMFDGLGARINAATPGIIAAIGRLPDALTRAQATIRAKVNAIKQLFGRWDIKLPKIDVQAMFSGAAGAIGVVASAFSLLKGHLGPISGLVAKLTPSLVRMSGSLGGVGGVVRGLTSPLGIVLSLLGAAYASNAQFRDAINGLLPVIVALVTQVASALAPAISNIIPVVSQIAATVVPIVAQVATVVAQVVASIISGLTPVITALVGFIASHAGLLTQILAGVAALIGGIKAATAVVGVVMAVVGKIVSVFRAVATVVRTVATAIKTFHLVMMALTGPVGIVVLAIGALVGGFVLLYKHSETFRNGVNAVWDGIKSAAQSVADWFTGTLVPAFQSAWDGIKSGVSAVGGAITGAFRAVVDWFTGTLIPALQSVWDAISGAASTVASAISGAFQAVVNWFTGTFIPAFMTVWTAITAPMAIAVEGIKLVWNGLVAFFTALWESIKAVFTGQIEAIKATIQLGMSVIKTIFTSVWEGIKIAASAFWLVLVSLFTGNFEQLKQTVSAAWTAIKNLFTTTWTSIVAAAVTFGVSLWSAITGAVSGVANAFRQMGTSIKNAATSAFNAVRTIASNGMNAMRTVVSTVTHAIVTFFTSMGSRIAGAARTAFNAVKSAASTAMNAMKSAVSTAISATVHFFLGLGPKISSAARNAFNAAVNAARNGLNAMKSAVSSGISGVVSFFRGLPSKIKSALGNLGNLLVSAGRSLIDGLGRGITSAMHKVLDTVRNVGHKITDAAKNTLKIHSPSRVFRDEVGAQIVAGLVQGIDRNAGDAISSVEGMASALAPAFTVPDAFINAPRLTPPRGGFGRSGAVSEGGVTVNLNGPTYGDPNEFARRIEQKQREALAMLAYA